MNGFGFFHSKFTAPIMPHWFAGVRLFIRQIRPEVIATAYVRTSDHQLVAAQQCRMLERHLHRQNVNRIGYR